MIYAIIGFVVLWYSIGMIVLTLSIRSDRYDPYDGVAAAVAIISFWPLVCIALGGVWLGSKLHDYMVWVDSVEIKKIPIKTEKSPAVERGDVP